MESIISSALEEICVQGERGVELQFLWTRVEPSVSASYLDLSHGVKSAIWNRLLSIPALQFEVHRVYCSSTDPSIRSFEDAERLKLKIVAKEHLRDNFLGLYNAQSTNANMSLPQRRALEVLAIARTNGITQSELAKEFGMEGRNFFYVVRKLECQGLIARQCAVLRTKEASNEGEAKNSPSVSTKLMYLHRYAKHLGCRQKIEITKEEQSIIRTSDKVSVNEDGSIAKHFKEDVLVKDYLPEMKALCDKLEEANGKVLVVSDVKKDLGYTGSRQGHRKWRKISSRLKAAQIVEDFPAKVNGKVEKCLRLLKKFSPKCFEHNNLGGEDDDFDDKQVKFGRKLQITDQVVELPIDQQIYDVIDAAGSEGLITMEVFKRLGIDHKRNFNRLFSMLSRYRIHKQVEYHQKVKVYRVTAFRNSSVFANSLPHKRRDDFTVFSEDGLSNLDIVDANDPERLAQTFFGLECATLESDIADPMKTNEREINTAFFTELSGDGESNHMLLSPPKKLLLQTRGTDHAMQLSLVKTAVETDDVQPMSAPAAVIKASSSGSHQGCPCVSMTMDSARREQMILERLQDEKFILIGELRKWIVSHETDKRSKTDKRTIDRTLKRLQQLGHCRCVNMNVPAITNYGRNRITQVVLHPSIQTLSPELLGEIHDSFRSFEIQVRRQTSDRGKDNESIPVLKGVQRIQKHEKSDIQAVRSETMRANGFILAKMIRAKLLHSFLWDYVNGLGHTTDNLSSEKHIYDWKNPHTSCKAFYLESAIKSIPFELFLQVVGSTKKFDDMVEKCKSGLCLSDFALEEYKTLMDTNATGRLSVVIEILRLLKLIRMVTERTEDAQYTQFTTFTLELKPYIEEPLSKDATFLSFSYQDLRPRIRHDFILSSRAAVDEYWQTLEYCYVAADPNAALHAFPGSAVKEVFLSRSWASVRVMTADQRAKLLERVVKNNRSEKLSYKECEKIAKDLDLSLEQVLRVYYDKRQQRLNRLPGDGEESQGIRKRPCSSSRRRRKFPEERSIKRVRFDVDTGQLDEQRRTGFPESVNPSIEEEKLMATVADENDIHLQSIYEDDCLETGVELGPDEDSEECYSLLSRCAFPKMKSNRERRFLWTDETDRQLVIQYVKYRAEHGPGVHRVDWKSVCNLPAPPNACKKRMALLNANITLRNAVMKLCNMLSKQYVERLAKIENGSFNKDGCRLLLRGSRRKGPNKNHCDIENKQETSLHEEPWDDFDDKNIKTALNEVLRIKRLRKLEEIERVGTMSDESSDPNTNAEIYDFQESESVESTSLSKSVQNFGGRREKISAQRSHCGRLRQKFIKILNRKHNVGKQVYDSLAVSNAVELFKLVFLSTSTGPQVPNLLAEVLRRYSEHDLFAAFNYLREKKIMIGGHNSPFVLSQQFLQSISKSPFPANSGKRASKFANWLAARDNDLMEGDIDLTADLECGDIFHLFALVASGELFISPCLPNDGVGEPEDLRSLKRKIDTNKFQDGGRPKIPKSVTGEGEVISRREKGFPGLMVSVHRATFLTADTVELFKDRNFCAVEQPLGLNDQLHSASSKKSNPSDHLKDFSNSDRLGNYSESTWETMTAYANKLKCLDFNEEITAIHSEVFKAVHSAIQKVGDQGLSIEEVSRVIDFPEEKLPELVIDVLQTFQLVLKVNAYDTVRVVDSAYCSKYFLTSIASHSQDHKQPSSGTFLERSDGHLTLHSENNDFSVDNSEKEIDMINEGVHRVTILNFPEEVVDQTNESESSNVPQCSLDGKVGLTGVRNGNKNFKLSTGELCMPILPWINGDGTINEIVFKGLRRRVLGIVMRNPGILEVDIIHRMDVLNPQSCKVLLELMVLDKHLNVRKMYQSTSNAPPSILGKAFFGSSFSETEKFICREHFFANPMSTSIL